VWSYELCGDKERLLFDRLSVFAPGYDVNSEGAGVGVADVGAELEAIEVVCADDVPIDGCQSASSAAGAIRGAGLLAWPAARFVSCWSGWWTTRWSRSTSAPMRCATFLLESLRLFASNRLAERSSEQIDEPARLARRHCYYYRDKVVHAQAEWFGPAEQELLTWASGAWSNIRRAIDTSLAVGEPVVGLQIGVGLLSFRASFVIGSVSEIRGRIEQTLSATQASQPQLSEFQLAAMAMIAWLAVIEGRLQEAEELLERCVAACDADAARGGYWRDQPDIHTGLPAVVDFAWGIELMWVRRDPRAIAVFARAREKFRGMGHRNSGAMSELFEGLAAGFPGTAEQAMSICQRHLERATAVGAGLSTAWAQMALAIALTKHGDAEEALQLGRAALADQLRIGDRWGANWAVHVRMWSLARLITDQIAAGDVSRSAVVKLAT
jgi:hypothetical protein